MRPDPKVLDEVVRRIVTAVNPLRIVLFGSGARGDMRAGSDIDILVVVPNGLRRRRIALDLYPVLTGVGIGVDIVVATPDDLERYANLPGLVYREAIKEGKVLYAA